MDKIAVVIDTNIFGDPEKYDFNNIRVNTFLNSAKESSNIDVYIPNIVEKEIKKHIKEALEKDKKNPSSKYFKDYMKKDFYKNAYLKAEKEFNQIIKKYKIINISCEDFLNINDINEWYFSNMFPFEDAKPKEFPDAMIVSAVTNFFSNSKYNKKYIISNDNGFNKAIERETDFLTYKNINSLRKELFGYDDSEITKLITYLQENRDIFKDYAIYNFDSYDFNDEIDVEEIESVYIKNVDILEINYNSITIEAKIDATINGNFLLFDPYESLYDNEDGYYYYIVQKQCEKLEIEDESLFLEIIKDDNGKIIEYNNIECSNIDLLNYLYQMDPIYEE